MYNANKEYSIIIIIESINNLSRLNYLKYNY